ncbi:hypothetical protein [Arthrobacter glacialis]|uniref:hypothetical protein n=1 Tax=Arthrobacter glacialis TaxID=1664 RepID=UPI0013FD61F2|nr:hypothetical protein [Arthrobacter glacialis]
MNPLYLEIPGLVLSTTNPINFSTQQSQTDTNPKSSTGIAGMIAAAANVLLSPFALMA